MNSAGTLGIDIPKRELKDLKWCEGDYVNIIAVGNTLHITKVLIE